MRLGLASYTYTWAIGVTGAEPEDPMTAMQLVSRAAELGVHVVQISDNLPLSAFSSGALEKLRAHAVANEVSIEVGTRGIDHDHLLRYLAIARLFDAPFLRVVTDTAVSQPEPAEILAALLRVMPAFERAGIQLAIENHDRFTSDQLLDMLRRIDSPEVGICLDTANSYGAQEGMREVAASLAPRTINLHVKDYVIARLWHNMGFSIEGRPAGQGMLDIPWLLNLVRSNGHGSPNAVIELWTPRQDDLDATIRTEARWAEESVRYMRQLLND